MPNMELEARLARLLGETFDAEKLRTFLRHHVSKQLADELPTPGKVAKSLYMAEAAEKLVGRGLVAPAFLEVWAAAMPGRAADIRALLPGSPADIHIHSMTNSALHTGTGSQTVTAAISNAPASSTRDEAIAQLREEVLAIQDLLVRSHKLQDTGTSPPGADPRSSGGATAATPAAGKRADDRGSAEAVHAGPVVRVLHLSDFHFREKTRWDASTVLGRLVVDVAGLVRDGLGPDLVVLTGDIAHSGQTEEYALASAWIRNDLLPAANVGVERLIIAAGNHDADRKHISKGAKHLADGIRAERDQQHVTEVMEAEDGRLLLRRLDAFVAFVNGLGAAGAPLKRPWHRTVLDIRGVRVHCAALASAWLSADNEDYGRLLLGLWQCNEVLRGSDDAHVVLAALHHPWDYVAEWDRSATQTEIERSVGLVLRGHLHAARYEYRQSVRHSGVLELAAGACYETSQYPNSYHLIEIRPEAPKECRARIYARFWDPAQREWRLDLNAFGGPFGALPLRVRGSGGH